MERAQQTRKLVVLVVDDEALIRLNACDAIEVAGHTVLEARNADEAITLLEAHPEIGVVVTDIQMPGSMDGVGLAQLIDSRWPGMPIIVSSGHAAPSANALPRNVIILAKPYLGHVLATVVTNAARAA
jgi:DNA-binding NtrC family response regulator